MMETILGIDPGTATTGYGLVQKSEGTLVCLTYGVISTPPQKPLQERLLHIYQEISRLIDQHRPDVIVVEHLFFGKNSKTALSVGRSLGVILLAAAQRSVEVVEYKPVEVKLAVTGYGYADKFQMQAMVQTLLRLPEKPRPDDAADALALCICYAHTSKILMSSEKKGSLPSSSQA